MLNRKTGEPIYPIEEKTVPKSEVPGEQASTTQPYVSDASADRPRPLAGRVEARRHRQPRLLQPEASDCATTDVTTRAFKGTLFPPTDWGGGMGRGRGGPDKQFAALVIVAQVAGKADGMTAFWAMSFFWLRLAHAVVYWAAIPYVRTVLFTLGFVCVAGMFWEVIK